MNISLTRVKFYTGRKEDLENHELDNGTIYFLSGDDNHATVAYDMNNFRYYVARPTIKTLSQLTADWVPDVGEIIIVSDATIVNGVPEPYVKIGDGKTNSQLLPFIGESSRIDLLEQRLDQHINDEHIHFEQSVTGTTYIVSKYIPTGEEIRI